MAPQADNDRDVQPSHVLRCAVSILEMWISGKEPMSADRLAHLATSMGLTLQLVREMEFELSIARGMIAKQDPAPDFHDVLMRELTREGTNVTPIGRVFVEVPLS